MNKFLISIAGEVLTRLLLKLLDYFKEQNDVNEENEDIDQSEKERLEKVRDAKTKQERIDAAKNQLRGL